MGERVARSWRACRLGLDRSGALAAGLWQRGEAAIAPFRTPASERAPYDRADPVLRRRLQLAALHGFVGSLLIFVGASLPVSPFTEKVKPLPSGPVTPAWFFGGVQAHELVTRQTPPPWPWFYVTLVCFYGGLVLLIRAWIRLGRLTREHPGVPVGVLGLVLCAWLVPMLFVAPLLSKDAYDYVAQGEMMSHHISPYVYGPSVLGEGANSYTVLTDKLWWYSTSPYGPGFLALAGVIQVAVLHSELWALVAWRFVALGGVALIAVFVPRLARSYGRDPGPCFVLAVMNPLVVVHLVGGEHNDALMLGLLVAGLALARERHPALGTVLVAAAALVKVPAALGLLYVGWEWSGATSRRARLEGLAKAGGLGLAVTAAVTQAVGLGWGWVTGLTNPDAVRSALDPMTAVGLGLGALARAVGDGGAAYHLLTVARALGALAAIAIGVRLLARARPGLPVLRAFGLTMLAVVILGPVMQPWYLAWGVLLLGPVAEGRLRGVLVWLTVTVTFLGLGDATRMLQEFSLVNPYIVAVLAAAMMAVLLWPVAPKVLRGLERSRPVGPRSEELAA